MIKVANIMISVLEHNNRNVRNTHYSETYSNTMIYKVRQFRKMKLTDNYIKVQCMGKGMRKWVMSKHITL